MAAINEQREIANEISEAISNPLNAGIDLDEACFITILLILIHLNFLCDVRICRMN